jgi:8-oxo-dGTP pyrophosphatase MutT (NUDIX family)
MSDQQLNATTNDAADGAADRATDRAADQASPAGQAELPVKGKKKNKGKAKPLEERKVYEAGAVIVCDGKVVLRLTDKQRWIFPKGKLKKHESPRDAAVREATEETGLKVEVIDEAADLLMRHEGKKRRFVFYLMRATEKTWDWPHHDSRDTFLISPERVGPLLRDVGYATIWGNVEPRVRALCVDPTPSAGSAAPAAEPADR